MTRTQKRVTFLFINDCISLKIIEKHLKNINDVYFKISKHVQSFIFLYYKQKAKYKQMQCSLEQKCITEDLNERERWSALTKKHIRFGAWIFCFLHFFPVDLIYAPNNIFYFSQNFFIFLT